MRRNAVVSRLLIAVCCVGMAGIGTTALAPSTPVFAAEHGASDAALTSAVKEKLKGKNFKDVTVMVQNGTVTLSGQVSLFAYKAQAVKKARKTNGVQAVRDNIAVGGPTLPDNELQRNLLKRIEMDRVGYGEVFNAISVSVQNGVVVLGGHALGPVAQRSAVSLAEYTPGVKEVINKISVDPVSQFDDSIRIATYRAIYGYPALQRYAIVPWKPIRISVQNGRVTLYGVVDSDMDKQLAYTRAMQVPNVFQVTNDLIVSNEKTEKSKKK
ncbi:MAG TPA: BON domain-containing protein [Acidobacteriaceae bacterium]|nr:BON domain-containing protein [Acidobacteriaceae bacterium]